MSRFYCWTFRYVKCTFCDSSNNRVVSSKDVCAFMTRCIFRHFVKHNLGIGHILKAFGMRNDVFLYSAWRLKTLGEENMSSYLSLLWTSIKNTLNFRTNFVRVYNWFLFGMNGKWYKNVSISLHQLPCPFATLGLDNYVGLPPALATLYPIWSSGATFTPRPSHKGSVSSPSWSCKRGV